MTQTHRDDHQTEVRVVAELAWTAEVDADRIEVAVDEGAVTLSGQVPSYPEKAAAVQAALRVMGVTVVTDELQVRHRVGGPTDADIARAATGAFAHTLAVPPGSVTATVHDHVVTLAGTVHGEYQREAAHRTVASLPGVVGVRDTVALEPTAVVSAQDALAGITAALVRNARLDAQHVHVDVTGSAVTLTGRVSSSHERSEAGQAAWSSPGVTHVHNRLTVAP
jgi:osmotically-inducible protein OsmY